MNRNDLIDRLVARKMTAKGSAKAGCVPCFGGPARTRFPLGAGNPARKLCFAGTKPVAAANP